MTGQRTDGDQRLHRLAPDVFVFRHYFSNSAVFVLPRSVVVVDTGVSPLAGQRMRRAIAEVTDKPVTHVVNTHYHGDHTGGNAAFEGAEILSTDLCRRYVHERDRERLDYADTFALCFHHVHPTVPASRTFSGRLDLEIDGEHLTLAQLGRVETPDACVVHWVERDVVACGDGVTTRDYPYLGVPFLDEGLRDDGEWTGFLRRVRDLNAAILIPGHGRALAGRRRIRRRLDLLIELKTALLEAVKRELAQGTPIEAIEPRVNRALRRYPRRRDLQEKTVSQRFAIYRCINNLLPERAGRGWWHDLRPSIIERAPPDALGAIPEDPDEACVAARAHAEAGRRPVAISLLEEHLRAHPDGPRRSQILGTLAWVLFGGAVGIKPIVDATEYMAEGFRAARAALELDPDQPTALLVLGAGEVFGGMVLCQPMAPAIDKLQRALGTGALGPSERRLAQFFIGKAHQMDLDPDGADRHYRAALPAWLRWAYPLLRARIWATP